MKCVNFVNALAEPVLVLDGSFRVVMANHAFFELFQIPPGHYVGCQTSELNLFEPAQVEMMAALETALEHSSANEVVEFTCIVPPGMYKCVSVQACRTVLEENTPEVIIAEFHDITRNKGAAMRIQELNESVIHHAEELKRSNENLELFAHSVSHDLRAPLRLMNMIAHELQLKCGVTLPETAAEAEKINVLIETTEELGIMVQNFLDLSQSNRGRLRKKKVDLYQLAKASLEAFKGEQEERDVQITLGELPPCAGDQSLIKQVYTNLLANAFKFTRTSEHAEIRIGCEDGHDEAVYFVSDNGIGLATSRPDAIFEPFCRLSNAKTFEGSGIGLALVKRIVEYHGGRIWADRGISGGTTIYFTLAAPGADRKPNMPVSGTQQRKGLYGASAAPPP